MSRNLLLPGLLLSLPLVTGWSTSKCIVTEGSRRHLVSRYFAFLPSDSKLSFLAACSSVTNLTEALEVVPQSVEGLLLGGSASSLPRDAFSAFPGLKALVLSLHLEQLQPGALLGLGHLQQLSFIGGPLKRLVILPPDAFEDLISLQKLNFFGFCMDKQAGVRLPLSLRHLAVQDSCLQDVEELAGMFPDLVQGSSSGDTWTLDILDLSLNQGLKMASPGSLQGLKLETLLLVRTKLEMVAVRALGLQRLSALSVLSTDTTEFPAQVVAHFELQKLNVENNKIGHIPQEALASCHSLKILNLGNTNLTDLPRGFLAAMPRLQSLDLKGNHLQSDMLCMNETGVLSGLWTLDLSQNGLCVLPPATFSCLPDLRELLLQDNQLVFLEGPVFQGLQQLETLNLDKNPLLNLGEDWLVALPALTSLSLLDTHILKSPTSAFWGAQSLHTLRLRLPSAPPGAVLSLPRTLTSLELHATASDMERWKLVPNVFPVLQTLTIKGRGLQLGVQNASAVFPALRQLSLLGSSLEVFCFQGNSNLLFWQFPKLQSLWVWDSGSNPRPCYISGLPSLQKLRLELLQSKIQPRSVQLEELVGELPQLQELRLISTGLKSLSATAFQRLGRLQVLVIDREKDLVLDESMQAHSPQMPQYVYILLSNLACQCANLWVGLWLKGSPNTYICILDHQKCQAEVGGHSRYPLFPFLWNHCPQALELGLFVSSFALVTLLISLPLLQEARNFWILYLQALFRAWLRGLRSQKDEGQGFLYDIFVSHCRQDQAWVIQELLPALEGRPPAGQGFHLCLPDRDFEPGKDIADNVADSMMRSRVTLCVLSRQALCTPRCRLELHLATSLLLAAPFPPVLLLIFLEPISRHQLLVTIDWAAYSEEETTACGQRKRKESRAFGLG